MGGGGGVWVKARRAAHFRFLLRLVPFPSVPILSFFVLSFFLLVLFRVCSSLSQDRCLWIGDLDLWSVKPSGSVTLFLPFYSLCRAALGVCFCSVLPPFQTPFFGFQVPFLSHRSTLLGLCLSSDYTNNHAITPLHRSIGYLGASPANQCR